MFKKKDASAPKKDEKEAPKEEPKAEEAPKEDVPTAYVSLRHVDKVYDNNVQAVFDFNLDIQRHEFIVFVGPSGCGKSTTLRMIAGLEDITAGDLYIDGEYSNDKAPKDRDIAMVFQSYALYPHMTVYNNMAFGLKIRHLPKDEIDKRVHDAAKILQIEEFLDRKPKALSGGQRQRVALGRAIVRNAKVFLMDEPLSNLDAKLRVQMRSEIIKLHEALNATTIYVTHDQTEAMTMASRIVVMKLGRIQQIGSPIEIYNHPANLFVASFIGSPSMNMLNVTYKDGKVMLKSGEKISISAQAQKAYTDFYTEQIKEYQYQLDTLGKENAEKGDEKVKAQMDEINKKLALAEDSLKGSGELVYGIRPEDIREIKEGDTAKDVFPIRVAVAELLGHEYYVHGDFAGIDLVSKIPLTHEIKIGDPLKIAFDETKAHIFDPASEKIIY